VGGTGGTGGWGLVGHSGGTEAEGRREGRHFGVRGVGWGREGTVRGDGERWNN